MLKVSTALHNNVAKFRNTTTHDLTGVYDKVRMYKSIPVLCFSAEPGLGVI